MVLSEQPGPEHHKDKEDHPGLQKAQGRLIPFTIDGVSVERMYTFTFLGTTISADLSWSANTMAVVNKSNTNQNPQQHLTLNN